MGRSIFTQYIVALVFPFACAITAGILPKLACGGAAHLRPLLTLHSAADASRLEEILKRRRLWDLQAVFDLPDPTQMEEELLRRAGLLGITMDTRREITSFPTTGDPSSVYRLTFQQGPSLLPAELKDSPTLPVHGAAGKADEVLPWLFQAYQPLSFNELIGMVSSGVEIMEQVGWTTYAIAATADQVADLCGYPLARALVPYEAHYKYSEAELDLPGAFLNVVIEAFGGRAEAHEIESLERLTGQKFLIVTLADSTSRIYGTLEAEGIRKTAARSVWIKRIGVVMMSCGTDPGVFKLPLE